MRSIKHEFSLAVLLGCVVTANAAQAELAVITNPKNAASSLTSDQVADIYLGKNIAFPDGTAATPADQVEGSAVRGEFYTKATGRSEAQVKAAWARLTFTGKGIPPKEFKSDADMKAFVAANPNAIGYIDKGAVDGSIKVVLSLP
jgi:ABC-type phosphate transport system substrate-binding protein